MSRATERRQSWLDVFADYPAPANLALEDVRRNIGVVDECLQDLWNLGENIFLAWTSRGERTLLLALPYYLLAEYVSGARPIKGEPRPEEYIGGLISGSKHLAADELQGVADKLGVAPQSVKLPFRPDDGVGRDLMSALVQRYGLAYTRNRPVLLVDIVGFSLFPAMEQVVLLQSLSHSVNSAYSKLAARNFRINFAQHDRRRVLYLEPRRYARGQRAPLHPDAADAGGQRHCAEQGALAHRAEAAHRVPCRPALRVLPVRRAQPDPRQLPGGRGHHHPGPPARAGHAGAGAAG